MSKFRIEFRWSMVFFLANLLWLFFEKWMGWHSELVGKHTFYHFLFGIIAILIFTMALINKRDVYFKGEMNWKQGFVSGSILSFFIAGLTPLIQYIMHTYISPDFFSNIIAYSIDNGVNPDLAKSSYTLYSFTLMETFSNLSYGIVTAAGVSWFVKKETQATPTK